MKLNKKTIGVILSGLLWLAQNLGWLPTANEAVSVDTKPPSEQGK